MPPSKIGPVYAPELTRLPLPPETALEDRTETFCSLTGRAKDEVWLILEGVIDDPNCLVTLGDNGAAPGPTCLLSDVVVVTFVPSAKTWEDVLVWLKLIF